MLLIEVEDIGNKTIIARLQKNGFRHNEIMDYIDRLVPGLPSIEVWTKANGSKQIRYMDISDLPELKEE